jgi:hypothetical protein
MPQQKALVSERGHGIPTPHKKADGDEKREAVYCEVVLSSREVLCRLEQQGLMDTTDPAILLVPLCMPRLPWFPEHACNIL